jgi:t-SNARE complex subunit (syntaxin)
MQDRLAELRGGNAPPPEPPPSLEAGGATSPQMREFYEEIEQLKVRMGRVEANINAIDEKYTESLTTINAGKAEQLTREMEALVAETNRDSQMVAARIKQLGQANKSFQGSSAERRIRDSTFAALAKRFYELMTTYQGLKSRNASKYRDKVRRQMEIASGEKPSEAQVDEVIEGGDPNRLFAQKLLQDRRNQDAANALVFMQDRHNDIVRLEKSINELYQIFLDMATLVEQQGEMLDAIEFNVAKSEGYQEEAVVELKKASGWAVTARKKKCLIAILIVVCIIVVGVAIAVPVALTLRK